ncbi:MAG TPA: TauD/TfdA family dioxygenase [Gammaproteobacteria bacterium]|nr:TauD/TfdA family dioxygenase [Gammaproteobacteria bacterium]
MSASPDNAVLHSDSPFDPDNVPAYEAWRERKLRDYPACAGDLVVEVKDPRKLTPAEYTALHTRCRRTNMAIYAGQTGADPDKAIPALLGEQFGLTRLDGNMGADDDGITALRVVEGEWRSSYIPYTNRPIHWHTDGYYNTAERQIRGLLLHCVSTAASGGENALLDHEIAYIHLRDLNPGYIRALFAPDAMTIPANIENGVEIRPARSGPVFSILPDGSLHMRYTARSRSIEWAADTLTREAAAALQTFLQSDSPWIYRATLQPGQGLLGNNVLHDRSGFTDSESSTRQLYRLRYYQRVSGT